MSSFGPTRASKDAKNRSGRVSGEPNGRAKKDKLSSGSKLSGLAGDFEFFQTMSKFVEGASASMRPVEAVIRELAQSDVPVLLLAERGAGKHTTAQRIHDLSRRSAQPFRTFHCSNTKPEDLQNAAIGEHTGAGTIFLQEMGELNSACQDCLQSALSRNGNGSQNGTPRFICGSALDLELEVKARRLREDLYYRISGVCLRLPPLRQRKEDIPILLDWFLTSAARDFERPVPVLSSETLNFFLEYHWPGNIRELKEAARAIVALGDESLAMGGLRSLLRRAAAGNGEKISLKDAARAASREAEKELILQVLT